MSYIPFDPEMEAEVEKKFRRPQHLIDNRNTEWEVIKEEMENEEKEWKTVWSKRLEEMELEKKKYLIDKHCALLAKKMSKGDPLHDELNAIAWRVGLPGVPSAEEGGLVDHQGDESGRDGEEGEGEGDDFDRIFDAFELGKKLMKKKKEEIGDGIVETGEEETAIAETLKNIKNCMIRTTIKGDETEYCQQEKKAYKLLERCDQSIVECKKIMENKNIKISSLSPLLSFSPLLSSLPLPHPSLPSPVHHENTHISMDNKIDRESADSIFDAENKLFFQ